MQYDVQPFYFAKASPSIKNGSRTEHCQAEGRAVKGNCRGWVYLGVANVLSGDSTDDVRHMQAGSVLGLVYIQQLLLPVLPCLLLPPLQHLNPTGETYHQQEVIETASTKLFCVLLEQKGSDNVRRYHMDRPPEQLAGRHEQHASTWSGKHCFRQTDRQKDTVQ